jgi:predicted nuclease of predicted toxin-antitoxin system
MKLLLDANLSPRVAAILSTAGHAATHVADIGMLAASDKEILRRAAGDESIIVTADTDFSMMLALSGAQRPSVVLLRGCNELPQPAIAELLIANLPVVTDDLAAGAIVSLSPTRLAVRSLPVG